MPNSWGLMAVRGMDAAQRANILIGYPFAFAAPVIPDWNLVSRSSDAAYAQVSRSSDDIYTQVTRSSDSDWSTINRSI